MFLFHRQSSLIRAATSRRVAFATWSPTIARPRSLLHSTNNNNNEQPNPMSRLYQEWTLEQDQILLENKHESIPTLAGMLGRGLRGVELRLQKLTDVKSPAYQRLVGEEPDSKTSLIPAKQVLQRIQYDYNLNQQDFTIQYYDRVQDKVLEANMMAPNDSISSHATSFVLALPEHRIVGILYKERTIWDRKHKIYLKMEEAVSTYDEWKQRQKEGEEQRKQRQAMVSLQVQQILGLDRFNTLKQLSFSLANEATKSELEHYIQSVLQLFREARREDVDQLYPLTDAEALDICSEWVALLPNLQNRNSLLVDIQRQKTKTTKTRIPHRNELPELSEDDLEESFVRGSGAGGQKINKTSNRVVLRHVPTNLKVECQDTRSLEQNRKIARQRLRIKLDEYLNGSQSRTSLQANQARSKKQKSKARNRARQRKKQQDKANKT